MGDTDDILLVCLLEIFLLVSLTNLLGDPPLRGAGLGAGIGLGKMILLSRVKTFPAPGRTSPCLMAGGAAGTGTLPVPLPL